MEKLRTGKWASDLATAEEVKSFREEARAMIAKYGWEDRTVCPYSREEPILDIVNYACDRNGTDTYENSTHSSKQYIIAMRNGLVSIMNAWEKNHFDLETNGVQMRLKSGKITKVLPEVVDFYLECGIGELIGEGA